MSAAVPFIGIDFGTSKSTMAWFNPDSGQAEILRNAEGKDETPSVVYFGRGERLVGDPAEVMLEDPEKRRMVVRSVKRDLVNQPSLSLPSGRIKALDVASTILSKLRRDAEELHFHRPVQRAVLTYPAAFDEMQLEKIQEAAVQAGFSEVVMLPEPVAAALAYGQSGLALGRHVLVYDLGGGTFDLALLTREANGMFRVALPPKGLARCGGDDFDRALYEYCDDVAVRNLGRGITLSGETDLLFLRHCRLRKETLSAAERCGFSSYLSGDGAPVRFTYEMSREEFETLIAPTVESTVRLTGALTQEAAAAGYPVETVVLIGGSSRIPLAQRRLKESLPVAPEKWQKQDVAVALGAALHGGLLWGAAATPVRTGAESNAAAPPATAPAAQGAGQPAAPLPPVTAGGTAPAAPKPRPESATPRQAAPAPTPHTEGAQASPPISAGPTMPYPAQPRAYPAPPRPSQPAPAPAPPAAVPHGVAAADQASVAARSARAVAMPEPSGIAGAAPSAVQAAVADAGAAPFGRRLGAYLIDSLITGVAAAAAATGATGDSQVTSDGNAWVFYAFWLLVQVVYYGYCWSAGGRTAGYLALGLRLTRRDGSHVPVGTALLRYCCYIVCALPIGIGFLWMLADPARRTWAERLTDTVVVYGKARP